MKALADNGMTLEEAEIEMHGGSPGPILGPSHDGTWLIIRSARGRILRWVCKEAGRMEDDELVCKAHPVPAYEEIARETGAKKWLMKAAS